MSTFKLRTSVLDGETVNCELNRLQGERIWLVCDSFLTESPFLKKIRTQLTAANNVEVFDEIVPDPPLEKVAEGVRHVIRFQPTVMLVMGGGSAIDTAKAVRYVIDGRKGINISRFIAMPSTSGTGSEVTSVSVITDQEEKVKYPIVDERLIPDTALLVPELVLSCPPSVTVHSGMDVLTHACEALVARKASAYSDAFAEKAIGYTFEWLPRCYENGNDLEARKYMHEASCLAGLAFETAGLGICHAISHQIGGHFHYPHGLINAILLPKVINRNAKDKKAAKKYGETAKKLQLTSSQSSDSIAAAALVNKIKETAGLLGCASALSSLNFDHHTYVKVLPDIIRKTKQDFTYKGNPVDLSNEDIAEMCVSIM